MPPEVITTPISVEIDITATPALSHRFPATTIASTRPTLTSQDDVHMPGRLGGGLLLKMGVQVRRDSQFGMPQEKRNLNEFRARRYQQARSRMSKVGQDST
jgi:hypothetical protein